MVALFLAPLYLAAHVFFLVIFFILLRPVKERMASKGKNYNKIILKIIKILFIIVYFYLGISLLVGFLLPLGVPKRIITQTGFYWMGIFLNIAVCFVFALVLRLVLGAFIKKKDKRRILSTVLMFVAIISAAVMSIAGIKHARNILVTNYEVAINKETPNVDKLRIALVADLHIGYSIETDHISQMVDKINEQNPDIVLIAGDFFDNEYEAIGDPDGIIAALNRLDSKYGTYAVYGNHDIKEKIFAGFTFDGKNNANKESDERMDELVKAANITLLRDEAVVIDDSFTVFGRPDLEKPGRGITVRKTGQELMKEVDASLPVIVLDHEPEELEEPAEAGVDLDLNGHTHNGQTFPGTILTQILSENAYGLKKIGNMIDITTSGAGIFGPYMRVGTRSEIAIIDVTFG